VTGGEAWNKTNDMVKNRVMYTLIFFKFIEGYKWLYFLRKLF